LDIKVVNALGQEHLALTCKDPLAAAEAHHDKGLVHDLTEARCARQGITYVPMVFTAQGGISKRAEAIMHQVSKKVALAEGRTEKEIFDEMVEKISRCLAKFGARATLRRSGTHRPGTPEERASTTALWETVLAGDPAADGDEADTTSM
jgi:Mg-chelatase subunit ChlI